MKVIFFFFVFLQYSAADIHSGFTCTSVNPLWSHVLLQSADLVSFHQLRDKIDRSSWRFEETAGQPETLICPWTKWKCVCSVQCIFSITHSLLRCGFPVERWVCVRQEVISSLNTSNTTPALTPPWHLNRGLNVYRNLYRNSFVFVDCFFFFFLLQWGLWRCFTSGAKSVITLWHVVCSVWWGRDLITSLMFSLNIW